MVTGKELFVRGETLHQVDASWTHDYLKLSDLKWDNKRIFGGEVIRTEETRCHFLWDDCPFWVAEITPEVTEDGFKYLDAGVNPQIAGIKIIDDVWGRIFQWTSGNDGRELDEKIKSCCFNFGLCQTGIIAVSLEVWFRRNGWLASLC